MYKGKKLEIFKKNKNNLRKVVLFKYAKECEMLKCTKCGELIKKWEDLTIDHKIPWRQESDKEKARELFWDLENIGFAHKGCNTPDSVTGINKNGYIGVTFHNRKSLKSKRYQGSIRSKGSFGYYIKPEAAAMARDMGIIKKLGYGILNFPHLRKWYLEILEKYPSHEGGKWEFLDEICDQILGK